MKTCTLFQSLLSATALSFLLTSQLQAQTYYFPDTVTCFNWDQANTEWDSAYRNIYVYTPSGNIQENVYQFYTTQWDNSTKQEFTYNSNNDVTDEKNFSWNGTAWDPSFRYLFFYNTGNKLIKRISLNWNGTTYDSTQQSLITYDGNGFKNSETYQAYSAGWNNSFKIFYVNDANGNVLKQVNAMWDNINTEWDSSMQWLRTFNTANLVLTETQQIWNMVMNQWDNSNKRVNVYNSSNQQIINYFLNWNNPNWDSSFRTLHTYDVNGNKTSVINQSYNAGNWENSFKTEFLYDANGNQIRSFSYYWNAGNWEPSSKDTTMYNANDLKTEWIYGYFNMGVYENSQRCVYNYESITFTGIEENPYQALGCLMPNPYAGQFVACDLKPDKSYMVSLFDMQGRLVMQQQVNNGANGFSMNTLPDNGLYIVQVQSEDGTEVFTKKLIINQ